MAKAEASGKAMAKAKAKAKVKENSNEQAKVSSKRKEHEEGVMEPEAIASAELAEPELSEVSKGAEDNQPDVEVPEPRSKPVSYTLLPLLESNRNPSSVVRELDYISTVACKMTDPDLS